jgi:plasmid stabilization system protein ParE
MTYRVVYSRRSQRDLDNIFEWVAQDSGEVETARRLIARILDGCDSLFSFPERFAVYPYARCWRMMPVSN